MSIIVHIFTVSFFSFFELPLINLKLLYSHFRKETIITSLFRKLTKVSTNDFKITDINGISG